MAIIKLASGVEKRVDRITFLEILPMLLNHNANVRFAVSNNSRRFSATLPLSVFSFIKSPLACLAIAKYIYSEDNLRVTRWNMVVNESPPGPWRR